ncbi:hypothetical protein X975_00663, partial [Stegodyphus mimosarum]
MRKYFHFEIFLDYIFWLHHSWYACGLEPFSSMQHSGTSNCAIGIYKSGSQSSEIKKQQRQFFVNGLT